jgi:hypothetical protein
LKLIVDKQNSEIIDLKEQNKIFLDEINNIKDQI